jgi:hypothetical protein
MTAANPDDRPAAADLLGGDEALFEVRRLFTPPFRQGATACQQMVTASFSCSFALAG